ncbi:hypothetical protein Megvenef_01354 [Candidatus Megaera venefica]|uniref:Antigenic heat-stable 120 kDa protein n=1 Tax=Candidatus Megaera venefica TaxID=2055910 RepID=A0ABU5NDY7_9RICK|nr:Sca4 family protein [Candidatus Megaera venefica]MEA0971377.1 hypothetical protein [Candidatus Megaera venefica]
MKPPEKTPQEKLHSELSSALETALGRSLNLEDMAEVSFLTDNVAHVGDEQATLSLDKGLQSLLRVTGLEASKLGPITELVASYHKSDPVKQTLVESSLKTFGLDNGMVPVVETPKKELAQAKANDFLGAVIKDLGGSSRLDDSQMQKVAELTSSLKNIGDPEGPARFSKALEEFAEIAPGQVGSVSGRIEEYYKNDSAKQALVTPALEPFKTIGLYNQITTELEGLATRKLTEPELLMVSELSQSVGQLKDKDGVGTVKICLDEVVKNLSPQQAKPIIDLVDKYHKNDPTKQALVSPVLAPIKGNELFGSITKNLEKASGRQLDDSELGKVAELTSSLKNIGDLEGQKRFNTALEEFVKIAPEQASSFIGRLEEFHKNEPEKQALVAPALAPLKESVKANELNQQIAEEVNKLEIGPLSKEQLLAVAELSQSVAYIKDKDDLGTLTRCLDEVLKDLTPEQAKPILDLVDKYHKDNPIKQTLMESALMDFGDRHRLEPVVATRDTFGSASVDEITQAIRDEVITKQQAYLQGEIAKTMTPENGALFNQKTPEEVRVFLATPEGKDIVKLIMSNKDAQLAMNKIEVEGYKKVHEAHKDSFKNVGWAQETGAKVRIAEITNEAGEKVASLKETTVDATPTRVTLEDGTTRDIKSYRQIDFPLELKDGKGPAHFSMAVKDENGRNISAKDAVYFTAHYDDNGKLMEVSSPVPVKFMGDGDDAIGYIERNGKVYTLPVTQGMYKDMMKEVAINNGLGVDVGQSVDSVSVPPRTVGQELQEPEILKKSGPVIDPNALQTAKIVTIEPLEMVKAVTVEPVLQMSKIVTIEPLEMVKAVTVEPVLQMSKIVTIEPSATLTFAEELQAKKASLTKTDLGSQVYGYDKPAKTGPDQVQPLSAAEELQAKKAGLKKTDLGAQVYGYDQPTKTGPDQVQPLSAAEELQAKKAGLKKTDLGAQVYGYDQPAKTGPDQAKPLTDAQKFEAELQAKKASLTKTDLGAQVYGYDKPGDLTQVEVSTGIIPDFPKVVMGPIVETVTVTKQTITLEEPKPKLVMGQMVETVTINVNPITGGEVSPAVMNKVQEIRQVLDTSLPRAPKKDNGKEALEMLNGKSSQEALEAISTAIGKGDGKLVKDMMDIIDKPPEGTKIPSVGKMALNKIYTDQMESTKGMKLDQDRSKVQRAAGAIADSLSVKTLNF